LYEDQLAYMLLLLKPVMVKLCPYMFVRLLLIHKELALRTEIIVLCFSYNKIRV